METTQLKLLSFASERVVFMPGESFIIQGDVGEHAYVILSGVVDVLLDVADGEHVINQVGPNSLIGEVALLLDQPRTASVRAHDRVECLKLSRDVFFHLVRSAPEMAIAVMRELARSLDRMSNNMRAALNRAERAERAAAAG
jgi:CRP/FNR family transcriptional regulator, cyclic AMP receptor protein